MSGLDSCPKCSSKSLVGNLNALKALVVCKSCGYRGPELSRVDQINYNLRPLDCWNISVFESCCDLERLK